MWHRSIYCLVALLALTGCTSVSESSTEPKPLIQAHSHNDYEHPRPLLDALNCGFCSVEADIYLVEGKLLVAHDRREAKSERTLQALYLEPLRQRVRAHGGRVYNRGPEFSLLIDIKDSWQSTYPVLRSVLEEYADILTTFREGEITTQAVRVIISGNRSTNMFAGERIRFASADGTLADLDSGMGADLVPWISSRWGESFTWAGEGRMPENEEMKLRQLVTQAHQQGRRVRFWGAPDRPSFWGQLAAEDVDLINTDDLRGLQSFLTGLR
jgi:hypothetical protein